MGSTQQIESKSKKKKLGLHRITGILTFESFFLVATTVSDSLISLHHSDLSERHWQGHVEATDDLWNILYLGITRQPAAWGQSWSIIGDVFIYFPSGQWNGAHGRCTWGLTAVRLHSPHRHRGSPLTWVTGSRPTRVVLPTWLARSSVPVGFLEMRLVQSLTSLKRSSCQLERNLCCC